MAFYYVLTATEGSILESDAPTSSDILRVLSQVQFADAQWVGPKPRVTRTTAPFTLRGFHTTFAWVLAVTAPYTQAAADAAAAQDARAVDAALATLSSDWSQTSVAPYSPDVNGDLSGWLDGTASITTTQDTFLTGTARLSAPDNPVGPNNPAARPPTLGEQVVSGSQVVGAATGNVLAPAVAPAQAATDLLLAAAVVGAAGFGLYYAWPWIMQARARFAPRANPRRVRRWRR
jgi:hypothetical protein